MFDKNKIQKPEYRLCLIPLNPGKISPILVCIRLPALIGSKGPLKSLGGVRITRPADNSLYSDWISHSLNIPRKIECNDNSNKSIYEFTDRLEDLRRGHRKYIRALFYNNSTRKYFYQFRNLEYLYNKYIKEQ